MELTFDRIFKGQPVHGWGWKDRKLRRLFPGYRVVVKDVAVFMSLAWLMERHNPAVVAILRHPCAVILSELNQGTDPDQSVATLLSQEELFEDHLADFRGVIEGAQGPFEKLAAIWAARHKVLQANMVHYPEIQMAFYEKFCSDPAGEFSRLFNAVDLSFSRDIEHHVVESTTTEVSGIYEVNRISAQQPDKWKSRIQEKDMQAVKLVIEKFQLPFYERASDWEMESGDH